jgi:CheY-like chemotaxis protein
MTTKCCLFISDDPHDQAIFTRALNDISPDAICFTVASAHEAFFMLSEENLVPDYIFVELTMPKMDGLEFLKLLKTIDDLKDIPVIVHSTSPQPQKIIELKQYGASAMYFKPYDYTGICNMLSLYLGSNRSLAKQN